LVPESSWLCKCQNMVQAPYIKWHKYPHITYAYSPIYDKSSLDYLQILTQCKHCKKVAILHCSGNDNKKNICTDSVEMHSFFQWFWFMVGWIQRWGTHG
jgi:hypothetical protein